MSWFKFVECRAADLISSCFTFYMYLMALSNIILSSLQGCDVLACNVGLSEALEQFFALIQVRQSFAITFECHFLLSVNRSCLLNLVWQYLGN